MNIEDKINKQLDAIPDCSEKELAIIVLDRLVKSNFTYQLVSAYPIELLEKGEVEVIQIDFSSKEFEYELEITGDIVEMTVWSESTIIREISWQKDFDLGILLDMLHPLN